MNRFRKWGDEAPIGIREIYADSRAKNADLHPHTVIIVDRVIHADSVEEMSAKIRQPVFGFAWATHIDNGEETCDVSDIDPGERAQLVHTLDSLRDMIAAPPECVPGLDDFVRDQLTTLRRALKKLEVATKDLTQGAVSPDDVCAARLEADALLVAAREVASALFAWESDEDERCRRDATQKSGVVQSAPKSSRRTASSDVKDRGIR